MERTDIQKEKLAPYLAKGWKIIEENDSDGSITIQMGFSYRKIHRDGWSYEL
jgi:hypothetical protein